MDSKRKLGIGAALATFGGAGLVVAPMLGATSLERPWSFLAGVAVGLLSGVGVALSISGLLDRHRSD